MQSMGSTKKVMAYNGRDGVHVSQAARHLQPHSPQQRRAVVQAPRARTAEALLRASEFVAGAETWKSGRACQPGGAPALAAWAPAAAGSCTGARPGAGRPPRPCGAAPLRRCMRRCRCGACTSCAARSCARQNKGCALKDLARAPWVQLRRSKTRPRVLSSEVPSCWLPGPWALLDTWQSQDASLREGGAEGDLLYSCLPLLSAAAGSTLHKPLAQFCTAHTLSFWAYLASCSQARNCMCEGINTFQCADDTGLPVHPAQEECSPRG